MRFPGLDAHIWSIVSPVLVGREDLVALAERRLAMAASGQGHLLLLTGEPGIGKTRLLQVIEQRAAAARFRIARAASFPGDVDVAGAMLEDLARTCRGGPLESGAEAILSRLVEDDATDDGGHRGRRLRVRDLAQSLGRLGADGPVLLTLEDLHWADDLTLEVLGHCARTVSTTAVLVVGTLRTDELYARKSLREWRARLLGQRLAEEVRVERLDRTQTASLAAAVLAGRPPLSQGQLDALFARSDGVPLHIEELLGLTGAQPQEGRTTALDAIVPDTLAEVILVRARTLSPAALRVAACAAVIGRSFDLGLLVDTMGVPLERLGRPLGELRDRYLVAPTIDGRGYDFRHALVREAIYQDLPLPDRRLLHARVAAALSHLEARPDDALLSGHYEQAGLARQAAHHALLAGRRAASLSAHREALHLFRRALANLGPLDPVSERAAILVDIGIEAAAADDNATAAAAYADARTAYRGLGQMREAAALIPPLVAARHLIGDDLATRVALVQTGLDELDLSGGDGQIRASLMAALASAYMLDRRLARAIEVGETAMGLARDAGDTAMEVDLGSTLGSALLFAGRMDEGWQLLERSIETARRDQREPEAARAYRMAGSCASVLVEYERARTLLDDGVAYAQRVELWNHCHYMSAHRAHVAWATGDWALAEREAERVLVDGRGGITTRITGLHVMGYVALGRGRWGVAQEALQEALLLGEEMAELQRISPAIWGLAEVALLQGDHGTAVELAERGWRRSKEVDDTAYLFPFLVTGTRALIAAGDPLGARRWVDAVCPDLERRGIPGTLPAVDHARGLVALAAGATSAARTYLEAARAGWWTRSRIWEGTWATVDLARCAARTNRQREAADLRAMARSTAQSLDAVPILLAIEALPAATRRVDRPEPWSPLTEREFQVARLVAQGWTNPEIAVELSITTRTAATHVEHILGRLGATRRAEIGAWVATVPLGGARPR